MAACVARLGGQSTFVGKIGHDAFGAEFLDLLREEGVDDSGVMYSDHLPTAVGMIIVTTRGTNAIVIDIGANGDFLPADIEAHRELVESADVVLSPLEIPLETALHAARRAKAKGVKSILNPAPALDLRGQDLSAVYALTPNETEARICLGLPAQDGLPDREVAQALRRLGPEHVMMTRGAQGVLWASAAGVRVVPALPVSVVDSVGAGDAFNAGLAVGLSEKLPLTEAIALGVTAASLSTEKRETIASYPYRAEVNARIKEVLAFVMDQSVNDPASADGIPCK
jgi:ribokinase